MHKRPFRSALARQVLKFWRQWKERQTKKRGEGKALGILAAKLARAVYHLWCKQEAFDEERFWSGQAKPATRS